MLKLNTHRTFPAPVTVHLRDDEGNESQGQFTAIFKILPTDKALDKEFSDKRLVDLVVVGVRDIELTGPEGEPLEGEALLEACRNDPAISAALVATYQEEVGKKNLRRT